METMKLNENQILEALRAAFKTREVDQGALTTGEAAKVWGCSFQTASRRIKVLYDAGELECVKKVCEDRTGVPRPQPAYRLANDSP